MEVVTRFVVGGKPVQDGSDAVTTPTEYDDDESLNTEVKIVAGGFHFLSLTGACVFAPLLVLSLLDQEANYVLKRLRMKIPDECLHRGRTPKANWAERSASRRARSFLWYSRARSASPRYSQAPQ